MVVEYITLRLIYDLFSLLNKNKFNFINAKLSIYNRNGTKYLDISDINTFKNIINDTLYINATNCELGDFYKIESFNLDCNLYNILTGYNVKDVFNTPIIYSKCDYDSKRVTGNNDIVNKQKELILYLLNKYKIESNKIYYYYLDKIYSPCYAELGWSEGTSYLSDMKNKLLNTKNIFS